MSRQISALEDDLRLKLFIRHARGLVLTEVGEQLFRTAHRMYWELQQVESQMSESQDEPTGPLLVTTTVGFGSTWLASRIDEWAGSGRRRVIASILASIHGTCRQSPWPIGEVAHFRGSESAIQLTHPG